MTNLPQKAFRVTENGVEQQIKVFRREDIPVSLGLVIDNSGSILKRRQKVEAAALQLVKASNPQDQVFIVNFNDEAYLDCPFTNSVAKLEEGLARLDARGGTAMRDAISMSIDYMKEEGKLDKKVILVVTDGDDNMSSITLERLLEKAQQAEVLVYTIGLLNEEDRRNARRAKRALDAITSASGGLAYYPEQVAEVDQIGLQVAHEIRNQYTIAYTPVNAAWMGATGRSALPSMARTNLLPGPGPATTLLPSQENNLWRPSPRSPGRPFVTAESAAVVPSPPAPVGWTIPTAGDSGEQA